MGHPVSYPVGRQSRWRTENVNCKGRGQSVRIRYRMADNSTKRQTA
jgi:hypothetical protein